MGRVLRGVRDVQNLSNSLRAQNEILQENHAELLDQVHARRGPEPDEARGTDRTSSSSTVVGAPKQGMTDTRSILEEKKAWRERNGRSGGNLCSKGRQVGSDGTTEEVDSITSRLKDLVTDDLKSVWDRLG